MPFRYSSRYNYILAASGFRVGEAAMARRRIRTKQKQSKLNKENLSPNQKIAKYCLTTHQVPNML